MSIFQRPNYTSDTTDFIAKLKADRPTLEAEQRAGRVAMTRWRTTQQLSFLGPTRFIHTAIG